MKPMSMTTSPPNPSPHCGEGGKFEERGPAIQQFFDAFPHRHLSLVAVSLEVAGSAPLPRGDEALFEFGHERGHSLEIGPENLRLRVHMRRQ